MTTENVKLRKAVNLEGKTAERFLKIQEKLGLKTATEVVRYLINAYYDKLME